MVCSRTRRSPYVSFVSGSVDIDCVERFLQIYEQSKAHKLFNWMNEFEGDYRGDMNAQVDLD